jgi:DNA-binding Xre family transcriptional regulator
MKIRLLIKDIAQARGMKQYELAEKSGVTPQLLNRYWNNNVQRVDLVELNKIAIALGVRPGDLITSEDLENAA